MRISFYYLGFCVLLAIGCTTNEPPGENQKQNTPYSEPHRPQFHFTPDSMWMNDPNGMVYYEGEYHLFYQYYPDSTVWGPMHWGHAVSEDLEHWEHLPIGLYPDSLGYIFSGSAVVDWKNTSGLGSDDQPPMIAIFTHHEPKGADAGQNDFQYQSIAYSLDKGRSWTKYKGNPVLPNPGIKDFRDPKVIWYEPAEKWIMVLAAGDHIKFYSSPNLIDWQHESDFGKDTGAHGGVWECPDLFPLTVEGTRDYKLWTLLVSINPGAPNGGSGTQYFLGQFDGKQFTMQKAFADQLAKDTAVWIDYGRDNYAGVTWSDIPQDDGRRIFMGWMSNWAYAQVVPTQRWRSAMTLARSLNIRDTRDGLKLVSKPVKETDRLRVSTVQLPEQQVSQKLDLSHLLENTTPLMEIELSISWEEGNAPEKVYIRLSNRLNESFTVGFEATGNQYFTDRTQSGKTDFEPGFASRHYAPRVGKGNSIQLHFFFDTSSAELFADNGNTVMTDIYFPNEDFTKAELVVEGGSVQLEGGKLHGLKSIWGKQ